MIQRNSICNINSLIQLLTLMEYLISVRHYSGHQRFGGEQGTHTSPWGASKASRWSHLLLLCSLCNPFHCISAGPMIPFSPKYGTCDGTGVISSCWVRLRLGLPWWLSSKESTCQCRRCRFNQWSVKIPHATEQLSPWATTIEALEP